MDLSTADLMPAWAQNYSTLLSLSIQVFILVFAVLGANFLAKRVLNKLAEKAAATRSPWDDALIHSVYLPLRLLMWILALTLAAELIYTETGTALFAFSEPLRTLGIIFALTWFLIRLSLHSEENLIKARDRRDSAVDRSTIEALAKLIRVSIIITAILVALQSLGFSISGVLAFGGVGGIAVGFAAKDMLANFFGGLMIYLDRPFAVGDWILSPAQDIEGTVEKIGWRQTCIRRFNKRPLYVPNSLFNSIPVENPSRMSHRRIHETIGIRYDDLQLMPDIVADVRDMLTRHPEIDSSQTLIVNFNQFNASSLDFFVYTFTKTTNWVHFHKVKQDVLLEIAAIIEGHGAEIAFPTQTLHIQGPGPDDRPQPPIGAVESG